MRESCLTAIASRNNFANIDSIPSPPHYLGLCILPRPPNHSLTLPERPNFLASSRAACLSLPEAASYPPIPSAVAFAGYGASVYQS
jgi:hypothetical protein